VSEAESIGVTVGVLVLSGVEVSVGVGVSVVSGVAVAWSVGVGETVASGVGVGVDSCASTTNGVPKELTRSVKLANTENNFRIITISTL